MKDVVSGTHAHQLGFEAVAAQQLLSECWVTPNQRVVNSNDTRKVQESKISTPILEGEPTFAKRSQTVDSESTISNSQEERR